MARSRATLRSTSLSRSLVRKLKAAEPWLHLGAEDQYALMGLNPGRNQKAAGAWAWQLFEQRNGIWTAMPIGGADPASEIVKSTMKAYAYRLRVTQDIECGCTPIDEGTQI